MGRASLVNKNGLTKGPWSREEDEKLRAYIQRYGHWNWRQLPKFAGLSRCGKSCRLRWMNYLRPGVKRGNFSKEEEDLIVQLHEELGNKWSSIAAKLPGRTDNEIKNHWHTRLKKRGKHNQVAALKEKLQSIDISRSNNNQKITTVEPESSFISNTSSQQAAILESFTVSQETTCGVSGASCVSEESFMVSLLDEESSGDFWSQPFKADFNQNQDDYPFSLTSEASCNLSFASYDDDDSMNLLYQMMQELLDHIEV